MGVVVIDFRIFPHLEESPPTFANFSWLGVVVIEVGLTARNMALPSPRASLTLN